MQQQQQQSCIALCCVSLFEQLGKQMLPLAKFPLATCHFTQLPFGQKVYDEIFSHCIMRQFMTFN